MEFSCARCGGRVVDTQCRECGAIYATRCPRCGNTLDFVQMELGGESLLRCNVCRNDVDLQMQVLAAL